MTHLRKMMLEELERRNYAQTTIDCYLRVVAEFSLHFHRPPNQLGQEHIRQHQAHLFGQRKLSTEHCDAAPQRFAILLHQDAEETMEHRRDSVPQESTTSAHHPDPEEVTHLINSALPPFHRILLMTLYATGARRAEPTRLQITDIDSRRMIIHIEGGKGRKDRDVMLIPTRLEALREYWRGLNADPHTGYFPADARIPVIVTSAPRPPRPAMAGFALTLEVVQSPWTSRLAACLSQMLRLCLA